jgi:putative transposase
VRYQLSALNRTPSCPEKTVIGIDAGCESLIYTSEGKPIENPRQLKNELKRLKHAQRELSRKKKGSKNRWKAIKKVRRIHRKVSNKRKNYLHGISADLVNRHSFIALENLKLKNMTASAKGTIESPGKNVKAKAGLNRSLLDAGIGMLFKFTEYKAEEAEEAGTRLEKVRPHGTSQDCSSCGAKVPKSLAVRIHKCDCGFVTHRDHNAALNILARGLKQAGLEQAEVWRAGVSLPVKHETATIASS